MDIYKVGAACADKKGILTVKMGSENRNRKRSNRRFTGEVRKSISF